MDRFLAQSGTGYSPFFAQPEVLVHSQWIPAVVSDASLLRGVGVTISTLAQRGQGEWVGSAVVLFPLGHQMSLCARPSRVRQNHKQRVSTGFWVKWNAGSVIGLGKGIRRFVWPLQGKYSGNHILTMQWQQQQQWHQCWQPLLCYQKEPDLAG